MALFTSDATKKSESLFSILVNKIPQKGSMKDDELKKVINDVQKYLISINIPIKLIKTFSENIVKNLKAQKDQNSLSSLGLTALSSSTSSSSQEKCRYRADQIKLEIINGVKTLFNDKAQDKLKLEPPLIITLFALYGAGKTTSVMRLAKYYKKRGYKVACIAADTYRAGAFDQLKQNCYKVGVPYYGSYSEIDPCQIVKDGLQRFLSSDANNFQVIIIDTAGRSLENKQLVKEMNDIQSTRNSIIEQFNINNPGVDDHNFKCQNLLVVDSTYGNAVQKQMDYFASQDIDGLILSKFDSQSNAGIAIYASATCNAPILYTGEGEGPNDFYEFNFDSFISKLLGQGDVKTLLKKIEQANGNNNKVSNSIEQVFNNQKKFSIIDFKEQLEFMSSLSDGGKISKMMELIPGAKNLFSNLVTSKKHKALDSKSEINGDVDQLSSLDKLFQDGLKNLLIVTDSLNRRELNGTPSDLFNPKYAKRLDKICRGCGKTRDAIEDAFKLFKPFDKMLENIKRLPVKTQQAIKSGGLNADSFDNLGDLLTMVPGIPKKLLGKQKQIEQFLKKQGMLR